MEFPLLIDDKKVWNAGDPGKFRILYKQSDNTFYRVAVHLSEHTGMMGEYGAPATKRDNVGTENGLSSSTDPAQDGEFNDAPRKLPKAGRPRIRAIKRSTEA